MDWIKVVFMAIALVSLAMLGLATQILLRRGGKFPNMHIGSNEHMKQRGVTCATSFDKMEQAKARKEMNIKELSLADKTK